MPDQYKPRSAEEIAQDLRKYGVGMSPPKDNSTVLEEANDIIYGDREKTYGHPAKNFEATADLWNGYMAVKNGPEVFLNVEPFNATDIAHMMMLLKIAREVHMHKRDNVVDMAGYAGCIQKMHDYYAQKKLDMEEVPF